MSRVRPLDLVAVLLVFGLSGLGRLEAAGPLEWSVDGRPGVAFGHTTYLLNEPDPLYLGVRSLLVFPPATPVVGLTAALAPAGWKRFIVRHHGFSGRLHRPGLFQARQICEKVSKAIHYRQLQERVMLLYSPVQLSPELPLAGDMSEERAVLDQ
jgi:hypothetical protein